jgi:hypothetical protein
MYAPALSALAARPCCPGSPTERWRCLGAAAARGSCPGWHRRTPATGASHVRWAFGRSRSAWQHAQRCLGRGKRSRSPRSQTPAYAVVGGGLRGLPVVGLGRCGRRRCLRPRRPAALRAHSRGEGGAASNAAQHRTAQRGLPHGCGADAVRMQAKHVAPGRVEACGLVQCSWEVRGHAAEERAAPQARLPAVRRRHAARSQSDPPAVPTCTGHPHGSGGACGRWRRRRRRCALTAAGAVGGWDPSISGR